jgi:hypothetical protein
MTAVRALVISALLLLAAGQPLPAVAGPPTLAPIVVNWPSDEPDADLNDGLCLSTPSGKCTLRAAVQHANDTPSADVILLSAGTYLLNRTGVDDTAFAGDLDIDGDLTIRGAGMHSTTIVIDSIVNERVLHVLAGNVRLEGLGLTGGYSQSAGGGIANFGALTLDHTTVFTNAAFYNGGNAAGGIYNSGQLTLTYSLVEYNAAYTFGGGLSNGGTAWIEASTFAHNTALAINGGGIHNAGVLYLVNSTISSNLSADGGSGLQNDSTGTTNAYNVTITANIANTDADAGATTDSGLTNNSGGVVNLRNSIVARNYELVGGLRYYDDCHGTLGIYGNVYFSGLGFSPPSSNVPPCTFAVEAGGWSSALVNIGAGELLPLANNGGPTPTHDLDPDSDPFNGGDANFGCLGPNGLLVTDQRGVPRVAGVRCDAGAVEHGSYWYLFIPLLLR